MGLTVSPTILAAAGEGLRAVAAGTACWLFGTAEPPTLPPPAPSRISLSCPAAHCECDCRHESAILGPLWSLLGVILTIVGRAAWATWVSAAAPRPAEAVRTPATRVLQDRTGDLADLPGGKGLSPETSTRSTPTPSVADSTEVWTPSRRRA